VIVSHVPLKRKDCDFLVVARFEIELHG
jgi:hypothetical protein